MKRKLFFNLLLTAVGVLALGSCSQDDESGSSVAGDSVEVQFTVGGISDYADGASAETRGAEAAAPFTVTVPIDEECEIEATFTPRKTVQTRAGAPSPLANDTRYRVLAYQNDTYVGYADYKINSGTSELIGGGLKLADGNYKFIAYSYNNSNPIAETPTSAGISEVAVGTSNDFLYWQSETTISVSTSLTITFKHLFPQLQVTFDSTEFGSDFTAASATLSIDGKQPKTSATWTVADGSVTANESPAENGAFTFSSVSGQSITSDIKTLLPISNTTTTPLKLTVVAIFANGKTVANKELVLAVNGDALSSNTSYACTLKFNVPILIGGDDDAVKGYPYGGGNCWVIPSGDKDKKYCFIAMEGRTSDKAGKTVDLRPTGAKVVWMDEKGLITEEPSYNSTSNKITFKVASGKVGNAVIAATDIDGTICWSWHIWVVSDNNFMTNPVGDKNFMDRNLGATSNNGDDEANKIASYGVYYQWGRKDPIPRPNTWDLQNLYNYSVTGYVDVDIIEGPVSSVEAIIKNPILFITSSMEFYHDWLNPQRPELWQAEIERYSPAPVGWSVPKDGGWDGFEWGGWSGGVELGVRVGGWYPGTGYWHGVLGNYHLAGIASILWLASTEGESSKALFVSDRGPQSEPFGRGYGGSIRCVRE